MSDHTTPEMRAMHDKLAAAGLIEVVTLSGGRSQLAFPQGDKSDEVQAYLKAIRERGDKPQFGGTRPRRQEAQRFAANLNPRWGSCAGKS